MFNFLRNKEFVTFYTSTTNVQESVSIPLQHLMVLVFFVLVIQVDVEWYLMVLLPISPGD